MRITSSRVIAALVVIVVGVIGVAAECTTEDEAERKITEQNRAAEATPTARSSSGQVDVFDLRVGDCVSDDIGDSSVGDVHVVPCYYSSAKLRVTSLIKVSWASSSYPGETWFDLEFDRRCDYDATSYLYPSRESWEAGDRTITCLEDL